MTDDVTENTYGKPTKWMAEALLAKLYINWPVYTAESVDQYDAATAANPKLDACIAACDEIINSGKFNLGSVDYLHKFSYDNGWKVEDFIYAIPYDAVEDIKVVVLWYAVCSSSYIQGYEEYVAKCLWFIR